MTTNKEERPLTPEEEELLLRIRNQLTDDHERYPKLIKAVEIVKILSEGDLHPSLKESKVLEANMLLNMTDFKSLDEAYKFTLLWKFYAPQSL
jgi:hypothetical protein